MSEQAPTFTPERLARALELAGFITVAETITSLQHDLGLIEDHAKASDHPTTRRELIVDRLDRTLAWAAHAVDLPSGMCSYAIQSARDAGWPEAEDLITRQVECLTHLRATCGSSLAPGLLLRTLAMYIDATGMGS